MVWVVSRFRLKAPPGISTSCISPLTSSGQRSYASWASQPQKSATLSPQPGGKPRKFIRTSGGIGGKKSLDGDLKTFSLLRLQCSIFDRAVGLVLMCIVVNQDKHSVTLIPLQTLLFWQPSVWSWLRINTQFLYCFWSWNLSFYLKSLTWNNKTR